MRKDYDFVIPGFNTAKSLYDNQVEAELDAVSEMRHLALDEGIAPSAIVPCVIRGETTSYGIVATVGLLRRPVGPCDIGFCEYFQVQHCGGGYTYDAIP